MIKLLIFIGLLLLAVAFSLWLIKPRDAAARNAREVRAALHRLLQRPFGAYVIIEEPAFGKFVQISGSRNEPLTFDLPCQYLTMAEYDRACELFFAYNDSRAETFPVQDATGSGTPSPQTSFMVHFGRDIEHAAQLVTMVFAAVYNQNRQVSLKILER